ncbi:MAG: ferric reductase-like transmembrane domain-containing protein [Methylomonas sp.]|nr:ferric reductase-like transmembrane domain-containing protein [Methylomonas sp.]PPD22046.1 MAG: sulfoxide reductase heme-binding subunit YedZ [Methylomonas sp.]PPD42466.1 MAG: sulfoxide reductase heme-binding subunit YedZ [Methylomonas sp.]PPD53884.1 MAG: sulfoxide reductase heme-binding subunit YedZ [Methylomonas sp.]
MWARIHTIWTVSILACLAPLALLVWDILADNLDGNTVQAFHIRSGDWTLRFLWLTLAITPLQTLTQWRGMAEYRQMLGLFALLYATLHLVGYLFFDHAGQWKTIVIDIAQSPYLWFGLLAYLIILLLGLTSPKSAKKKMGKSWKKLHRLIYLAAAMSMLHYFWQLKTNLAEPLFYLAIIIVLFAFRVVMWFRAQKASLNINTLQLKKQTSE